MHGPLLTAGCISCTLCGMKLIDYMKDKGLTDAAFGAKVGVDRATVSRWRRGVFRPDWDIIEKIEEATGGMVTAKDFVKPQSTEAA